MNFGRFKKLAAIGMAMVVSAALLTGCGGDDGGKKFLNIATGGTAEACARLVEGVGAKVVKMLFVIELEGFAARSGKLAGYEIESLIAYPGK